MNGEEPLQGTCFVQLLQVLAVDVGDEGRLKDFLRTRTLVVADHHLDRGEPGLAGSGESAAAIHDYMGGVWFELCFPLRVRLDVGVTVHHGDGLLLPMGLEAAGQISEISETTARVGGVETDPVDGKFRGRGDTIGGHTRGGGDCLAPRADGTHSPTEPAGT
ncbi:hypothetical protein ADL25_41120 [Streptomyces sp. NRRL F-5122]|nr:hypothetical protein ADL25_41120 [Streptomyces sp. NRRL F-5122]